jgi:chromosome partitioning protein
MNGPPLRAATFIDKGGTGKTTTAAHLGVALANHGYDVLLLDLAGKQGDLAKHFGVWDVVREDLETRDDWPNISTVFDENWPKIVDRLGDAAVDELIIEASEGVDLVPAHPGLDSLDAELANIENAEKRYSRLNEFLTEYVDPLDYDIVLIDLPGLTNNVSYNGLWAAQHIVAPVEAGEFEAEQAAALQADLAEFSDRFNVDVQLTMLLPNKIDQRTTLAEEYLEQFRADYPDAVAPAYIPTSQDIRNAAREGETVFAREQVSATAERAQDAFIEDAEELLKRLRRVQA